MMTVHVSLHRFVRFCAQRLVAVSGYLMAMTVALAAGPALAAITTDGNVQGFAEGYSTGYAVNFNIENGPAGVSGGKLFVQETSGSFKAGLIIPLNIDDNTYGANKAEDWGAKVHNLYLGGGGQSLEGSDKWEFFIPVIGGGDIQVKVDYVNKSGTSFLTRIEKFKQDKTNLDTSKLAAKTSIDYNFNVLGYSTDDTTGFGVDSPSPAPAGNPIVYGPYPDAPDWVNEIMYEFDLDKSVLGGDTINTTVLLGNLGTLHMSPNKLGHHKVWPILGDEISPPSNVVPEPSSILVWSLLGAVGLVAGLRRWRRRLRP